MTSVKKKIEAKIAGILTAGLTIASFLLNMFSSSLRTTHPISRPRNITNTQTSVPKTGQPRLQAPSSNPQSHYKDSAITCSMALTTSGPTTRAINSSPWALGWTPSLSIPVVKPAWTEQSAIQMGDSVELRPAAHASMRAFRASIGCWLKERGMTLSTCRTR